jgi:hypothetical protein
MKRAHTARLALAALATAAATLPASRALATIITSTFDNDTEGWTFVGDPNSTLAFTPNGPAGLGGAIQLTDGSQGTTDYFVAPAKFLGDLSAFYHGSQSSELRTSGTIVPDTTDGDLILSGPAGSLFAFFPSGGAVTLDETAPFHFGSATGPDATAAQVQAVLANVTSLKIRADFANGPEVTTLDNFSLSTGAAGGPVPVPTPAAFPAALTVLAALPLATQLRRRARRA